VASSPSTVNFVSIWTGASGLTNNLAGTPDLFSSMTLTINGVSGTLATKEDGTVAGPYRAFPSSTPASSPFRISFRAAVFVFSTSISSPFSGTIECAQWNSGVLANKPLNIFVGLHGFSAFTFSTAETNQSQGGTNSGVTYTGRQTMTFQSPAAGSAVTMINVRDILFDSNTQFAQFTFSAASNPFNLNGGTGSTLNITQAGFFGTADLSGIRLYSAGVQIPAGALSSANTRWWLSSAGYTQDGGQSWGQWQHANRDFT